MDPEGMVLSGVHIPGQDVCFLDWCQIGEAFGDGCQNMKETPRDGWIDGRKYWRLTFFFLAISIRINLNWTNQKKKKEIAGFNDFIL